MKPARAQRKHRGGSSGSRAFTLIELMVVMVLIGIAAAIILPEMKGTMDDMLLRSTARELVSAFALASSQAATAGVTHRVRFEPKTRRYLLERTGNGENGERGYLLASHVPGAEGKLDRRIEVEFRRPDGEPGPQDPGRLPQDTAASAAEPDTIAFYPDGTADAGEVLLRDRQGFTMALRVNGTTGRVRMMEPEPK